MATLAIKGHATRGNEVIGILEMLGGKKTHDYIGVIPDYAYSINEQGMIEWFMSHIISPYAIFTLEEFLEKFPYKVGDKVKTIYGKIGIVSKPIWSNRDNCIRYELEADTDSFYFTNELQPYKEETTEGKNNDNWAKWDLPDGYEFQDKDGNIINTSVIRLVKKQLQYPKTYEECCKILNIPSNGNIAYVGNWVYGGEYLEKHLDILRKYQQLIICRNAYWKIAGDWKPDWGKADEKKYCIVNTEGYITKWVQKTTNKILAFPTEEMRDAFFENFKDLIELCKELL